MGDRARRAIVFTSTTYDLLCTGHEIFTSIWEVLTEPIGCAPSDSDPLSSLQKGKFPVLGPCQHPESKFPEPGLRHDELLQNPLATE